MLARAWVAVVILCGCTVPYGAYLEVDGRAAGITYDRVQFFFGKYAGDQLPTSPKHIPATADVAEPGTLFKRLFAETDLQELGALDATFTYYLPPRATSQGLGEYVVAVAFVGDKPVGIAEVTDFKIPSAEIWRYPMPLVPVDREDFELWGNQKADCVRWKRARALGQVMTTLAVVRPDDHDCDGFADKDDCAELEYCADSAMRCDGRAVCFLEATCQIGACSNVRGTAASIPAKTCAPTACIGEAACNSCRGEPDIAMCLDAAHWDHPELKFPVTSGERLCATPSYGVLFPLPGGKACTAPRIELPVGNRFPNGYRIDATPDNVGCKLTITEPQVATKLTGHLHALLSIADASSGTGRTTILIALTPIAGDCSLGTTYHQPGIDYGICPSTTNRSATPRP
ncbi:MAG: hypothetical protein H0T46_23275 [Deltaproteobacteria bacterium]|nr:hypothetical protein [Deltaproteobacteria bacterium]